MGLFRRAILRKDKGDRHTEGFLSRIMARSFASSQTKAQRVTGIYRSPLAVCLIHLPNQYERSPKERMVISTFPYLISGKSQSF